MYEIWPSIFEAFQIGPGPVQSVNEIEIEIFTCRCSYVFKIMRCLRHRNSFVWLVVCIVDTIVASVYDMAVVAISDFCTYDGFHYFHWQIITKLRENVSVMWL